MGARFRTHLSSRLMATFRFTEDGCETSTAETETLLQRTPHANFGAGGGNSVVLAVDPHAASAIVDFKNAGSQCAVGIGNAAADSNFFADEMTGITIDPLNVRAGGACRQNQRADGEQ